MLIDCTRQQNVCNKDVVDITGNKKSYAESKGTADCFIEDVVFKSNTIKLSFSFVQNYVKIVSNASLLRCKTDLKRDKNQVFGSSLH